MANDVAARAVRRARQRGASPRVIKALVEAGLVESNMTQLRGGDRDSTGFLQQRPSQGWGPVGESVERDTDQFLEKAMTLNKGFRGSAGQLAQQVQRSAFPGRYAQRGVEAEKIIRSILGGKAGGQRERFSSGSSVTAKTTPGVDRSQDRRALMASYLLGDDQYKPGGLLALKSQLDMAQDTPAQAVVTRKTSPSRSSRQTRNGGASGRILEMFHDPGINIDNGKRIGPIGGHGGHVHAAFDTPQAVIEAARLAREMGLRVGENPAWDPVDPVHTEGSLHYQRFKNRPKIGKAIDVSGDAKKLARYNRLLAERFAR